MNTSYMEIYEVFLSKLKDYDLILEEEYFEEIANDYLKASCVQFSRDCKVDLISSLSDNDEFSVKLDSVVIDILATCMAARWLEKNKNNIDNLRNKLNTHDFQFFSPANLLEKIVEAYEHYDFEARQRMYEYSFDNVELKDL